MDTREPRPRFSRHEWCVAILLAVVLAVGLWQGYGAWLLSAGGGHAG